MIYYHGTNKENANRILKNGFKIGTYFTWDLHSALVFGGQYIFGVYFPDLNIADYWEYRNKEIITPNKILFLRRFDVECLYDNDIDRIAIDRNDILKENENTVFCENCKGTGQMNPSRKYAWYESTDLIVCPICKGHGYIQESEEK